MAHANLFVGFGLIALLFGLFIGLVFYFVPSFIAFARRHPHRVWILLLNIFFGWTFLGWIGALVWALIDVLDRNSDRLIVPLDKKICPGCAYQVERTATVCRFCGHIFGGPIPPPLPPR